MKQVRVSPPFPTTLFRVGWRYLSRHTWQSLLMVVGISLGVAVIVAIDLANASAERAFRLSTETITGKATHQILAGPQGLDETIYTSLKRSGLVRWAAPVISETVSSPQLGNVPLQLMGIDPFAEAPFRETLGEGRPPSVEQMTVFLTQPGAVLLSRDLASQNGLGLGSEIELELGGRRHRLFIAGLLEPANRLSQRSLSGLILADLSSAQEITGRVGKLDRIDIILPENGTELAAQIAAFLPQGLRLTPVVERQGTLEQMTRAFQVNLTALSLLALLVGLFLIYNTITFSVIQRRALFGTLRCLGVTRGEIFSLVLSEALLVGVLGSAIGVAAGILMGQGTVRMVMRTINDLYFTTTIRDLGIPLSSLVKGGLVGVLATLATTIPPAWEAASIPPRAALSRSGLETKAKRAVRISGWLGLALIGLGAGLFALPTRSLAAGFGGTLSVVVGFAMLSAVSLTGLMRIVTPITGRTLGLIGKMAPRNLVNALSRTSVAIAALMVAVAVTIGVSLMINSFRHTVVTWLEESLQGDVYISAPDFSATAASLPIDPRVIDRFQTWPGVRRVDLLRVAEVDSDRGRLQIMATSNADTGSERYYQWRTGSADETWKAMEAGSVLLSEPLANRLGIVKPGGQIELQTPQGPVVFPVAGIFYDYSSSQGMVLMSLDVYQNLWADTTITAVALRLIPGSDADEVTRALQQDSSQTQALIIRPNRALREEVLEVFDRTFAITSALQVLATVVAFIGVLNALLLLQLEKQREVGILRSVGLTARQLWKLVMIETGLMGLTAGLLAIPAGYALSLILIYVINQRSFGWTLQMDLGFQPFLQALGVAILAALLAGLYPAHKLGRMAAADAIRFE